MPNELPFKIIASDACPPDRAFLIDMHLSLAESAELARRVSAGEDEAEARADIITRGRKAAVIHF